MQINNICIIHLHHKIQYMKTASRGRGSSAKKLKIMLRGNKTIALTALWLNHFSQFLHLLSSFGCLRFEAISSLSEATMHTAFLIEGGGCIDIAKFAAATLVPFHRPICNPVNVNTIQNSGTNSLWQWFWRCGAEQWVSS